MDYAPMMTAADLAARLNVSLETVYKMCKIHKWPHSKIGRLYRFSEEHYQAIIATPVVPERNPRTQRENMRGYSARSPFQRNSVPPSAARCFS